MIRWHRDSQGLWADSPTEALRYRVHRSRSDWTVSAHPTEVVAGITTTRPMVMAVFVDRNHSTRRIAKAVAEAYEVEPERVEGKATNRLTRAIDRAYREDGYR